MLGNTFTYIDAHTCGNPVCLVVKGGPELAGKNISDKIAIISSIQGWTKIFGYNTIIIDVDDDPYAHGFQVV